MRSDLAKGVAALTAAIVLVAAGDGDVAARTLSDGVDGPRQIAAGTSSQARSLGNLDRLNGDIGKLARQKPPARMTPAAKAESARQTRTIQSFQKSFTVEIDGLKRKLNGKLSTRERTRALADTKKKVEQALRDLEKARERIRKQRDLTRAQFQAANEQAAAYRTLLASVLKTLSEMQKTTVKNTK